MRPRVGGPGLKVSAQRESQSVGLAAADRRSLRKEGLEDEWSSLKSKTLCQGSFETQKSVANEEQVKREDTNATSKFEGRELKSPPSGLSPPSKRSRAKTKAGAKHFEARCPAGAGGCGPRLQHHAAFGGRREGLVRPRRPKSPVWLHPSRGLQALSGPVPLV